MSRIGVAVACLVVAAGTGRAQHSGSSGGSQRLSDRVRVTYQSSYVESAAGERSDWMRFVILWRGQPGWQASHRTPEQRVEAERIEREAMAAATLANRTVMGSPSAQNPYWAELDRGANKLLVLGSKYTIPGRDSTLVILVDHIDHVGGEPAIVAAATLDGRISSGLAGKTWRSGDTTFIIRPARSQLDVFLETLRRDPAVAAFIQ